MKASSSASTAGPSGVNRFMPPEWFSYSPPEYPCLFIDYRNRTTETGQSIAATHTLDRSLLDTFYVNLHSVSKALRTALRKQVCEVLFIPDLLQYRVYLDPGIPPESIAVEVKDALKYGMLCWWYGGRDIPLFQLYRSLYETTVERLRDQIRSTHTERPYRIL